MPGRQYVSRYQYAPEEGQGCPFLRLGTVITDVLVERLRVVFLEVDQ